LVQYGRPARVTYWWPASGHWHSAHT